ncbi:hypothetical protein CGC20_30165 [Leishmania donovani]|uniref:Uncharacterized protein n=1 Tax=Leishmania donovani TaxID=5661 RepID=A0A504Y6P9_LEIDO|nr:hypothetical protein CGC20_30165 [Leishmania donovani]
MPRKKNAFMYSIDPELYTRSHAPASTIAMGMKSSQASSLCWANQVQQEERIREMWGATYDPHHNRENRALQAVQQTRARDAARHEAYVNPEHNPELCSILYKKVPPFSVSDAAAATAASSSPQHHTTTEAALAGTATGTGDPSDSAFARSARSVTQEYLQARCRHHTLQQRYPSGPVTAAQAVGWAAGATDRASASSLEASSSPYRQVRRRQIGAYRKPEDDEHALLFGYDYTPNDTNARAPHRSSSCAVGARRPSAGLNDNTRSISDHSSSTESGNCFEAHTLRESWRSIDRRQRCRESAEPPARQKRSGHVKRAKDLLLQCPPAGKPATPALAQKGDVGGAAVQAAPAVAAQDIQGREEQHPRSGGGVLPLHHPLYCTRGEALLEHPRHACPSDGDGSYGTSGRRGFRSPVKLQRTSPERSTHVSRTIAASRREGPFFRSAGIVAYSSSSSSSTRSASSSDSCGGAGDGGHTRRTARLASPKPLIDARKVFKMSPNARLARVRGAVCAQQQQGLPPSTLMAPTHEQQLIDPESVTAAPTATAICSAPPSFLSPAKRCWSSSGVHRESAPADADPSDNGGDGIHEGCASHHSSKLARHAARLPPREAENEVPAEVMGVSAAQTLLIRRGERGSNTSEYGKGSTQSHSSVQRNVKSARRHRRHHRRDYAPAHVVLENATPRRADDGAYSYGKNSSDSMLASAAEVGSSRCGRWPPNARSARSLESMASPNVALACSELQRQYGASLSSRSMQAAFTAYLHRSGHVSGPEGNARQRATPVQDAPPRITHAHDALPAQQRPNMKAVAALSAHSMGMEPAADELALEKEVLLLRYSLLITYALLAATAVNGHDGGCVGAMAERPWQHVARHYAKWTTETAQRAHGRAGAQAGESDEQSRERRRRHRRFTAPHLRGPTPWPALEARLAAAVQAAAEELLFDGDAATAPQALPPPRLLLRESPPHDVVGLPSVWYPPHRSDENDGPLSGRLWVWFSGDDGGHSEDGVAGVSLSSSDEGVKCSGDSGAKRRSLSEDSTAWRRHERRKGEGLSSALRFSRSSIVERRRPQALAPSFRGAWRRCFVVADDSGVCVYPTERDYADFASESLLMAVPYASLAYLIPDFAAAAAAVAVDDVSAEQEETGWSGSSHSRPSNRPGRGGYPLQRHGSLEAVHVSTIEAVTAQLVTDATYTYFGFLHCQRDGVARRAAGMTEAFSTALQNAFDQEQGDARPLGFAPWRVSGDSGQRYAHRPHAPLLLRTQSRAAHAEWVHFFAVKFNRHLYRLLFPTSSAAAVPKPPLTLSASSTQRQQHVYDGAASPSASSHHRSYRLPHADEALEGKDRDDAQDEVGTGTCALHRLSNSSSSSIQVGDSCDYGTPAAATVERAAAEARREVRGASLKNTNEAREAFSSRPSTTATPRRDWPSGACEPWWETTAALRYSVAQRDQQLQGQERKMADMAEALRQHAQRVHSLEENQDSLRTALRDARDRLANVSAAEGGQQWEGRAEASSKYHIHLRHLPPSVTTPRKRHMINPGAFDQPRSPRAPGPTRPDPQHQEQQCELESLQAQLEELQRRYTEDAVSWRAERAALESRCLASEEKLEHLRSGTSRPSRSPAHQVVHEMGNDDHEIRRGTEGCVDAVSSGQMLSSALAAAENNASAAVHVSRSASKCRRNGGAVPPITVASAPDNAFASLLLTFEPSRGRAGAHAGACVDGALIVDEASARLLFSGPTANQRGRRWELRHRDTDALLRIQLELLSRAPGDARATTGSTSRRRSQAASASSAPTAKTRASSSSAHSRPGHTTPRRPTGAAAGALLPSSSSPPPAWSVHAYDQRSSHHYSPLPVSAAAASCSTASTQPRAHMSSLLQTVNMMPRHTRASLLRQAAVEQKIQVREAEEERGGFM